MREPPIMHEPILEYFGIDLHLITAQQEQDFEKASGIVMDIPAFLLTENGRSKIFVRDSDTWERKRLSIFHECGHFHIPWHRPHAYICECNEFNFINRRDIEKEAYKYASHIIFPQGVFVEDVRALPISLNSIELLATRYMASFEATGIRYIESCTAKCALLYVVANFWPDTSFYTLHVRYCVKSNRFYGFWKPGTQIDRDQLIDNCLMNGVRFTGEIPASLLGSSKSHRYLAEIKPHGPNQICMMLQIPDNQTRLI